VPDAVIDSTGAASVRAERLNHGNGRVYVIRFSASDGRGGQCEGSVSVCVPTTGTTRRAWTTAEVQLAGSLPKDCGKDDEGHGDHHVGDDAVSAFTLTPGPVTGKTLNLQLRCQRRARSQSVCSTWRAAGCHAAERISGGGAHQLSFNASGLERGMYFYRLQARSVAVTRSVLIRK